MNGGLRRSIVLPCSLIIFLGVTSEPGRPVSAGAERQVTAPIYLEEAAPGIQVHRLDLGIEKGVVHDHGLSLASADLDEDGVADLMVGHSTVSGGAVAVHIGNVDAIFPNSVEARGRRLNGAFTPEPFPFPARLHGLPEGPDLLATGDFDNDGHWDVVAATEGGSALWLMRGDGRGSLTEAEAISLPGAVTAMEAGEINRRDGLQDLAVAVSGASGPQLLVFEGPGGALLREPEAFALPSPASAIALGRFGGLMNDVAVACGSDLVLVQGRDRRLSLSQRQQARWRRHAARPSACPRPRWPSPRPIAMARVTRTWRSC